MICRHYQNGQQLDVAGLNVVTVLVDRSGGKASFVSPTISLLQMEPVTFDPRECPMCAKKIVLEHPGS